MTQKIYEWHKALSLNRRPRQLIPRTTLLRWIGEKKLKTYGHRGAAFAFDPADIERLEMLGISFSKMSKTLGVTRSALPKMGLAIRAEFNLTSKGAKSERDPCTPPLNTEPLQKERTQASSGAIYGRDVSDDI